MVGSLTISIEVELGWGVHDLQDDEHLSEDGAEERKYLQKFLAKADSCGVPVSFDIVGHLLLEECDGVHQGAYPDGWFASDPGTDVDADPLFYAPELAADIVSAQTDHELCTHTFSHLLCGEASGELLECELETVRAVHEGVTESVTSFVPPRHQRPSNGVLHRNGITNARYAKQKPSRTPAHRFKELTIGPHPVWRPQMEAGVLETYCTSYPSLTARSLPKGQKDTHALFRRFPIRVRKRVHEYYLKRSVRELIERESHLHLWCHLFDFSNEHQWDVLRGFLDYLRTVPDTELQVLTMREFSRRYRVR